MGWGRGHDECSIRMYACILEERASDPIIDGCDPPCDYRELNSGPCQSSDSQLLATPGLGVSNTTFGLCGHLHKLHIHTVKILKYTFFCCLSLFFPPALPMCVLAWCPPHTSDAEGWTHCLMYDKQVLYHSAAYPAQEFNFRQVEFQMSMTQNVWRCFKCESCLWIKGLSWRYRFGN